MSDFDLFLSRLKALATRQNRQYKQIINKENKKILEDEALSEYAKNHLLRPSSDSNQYLDVMGFIDKFPNLPLSNQFKKELLELINKYQFRFGDHWMIHFYLIRDVIQMNLEFTYQRNKLFLPFGDKKDKYDAKVKTIIKKNQNVLILPKLSPYERIKFFQNKCTNELLEFYNFGTNSTTTRNKDKDRNSLIFELCKLSVCDNYRRNIKESLRVSGKENYENEIKIIFNYHEIK